MSGKQVVCVDLDGVIARVRRLPSGGFPDSLTIDRPYPRAGEFLRALSKRADVVIYTARCGDDMADASRSLRFARVKHWLEDNGLPYGRVYLGYGKPVASAYVDDHAVVCRPADDLRINDYEFALGEIQNLLDEEERAGKLFTGT